MVGRQYFQVALLAVTEGPQDGTHVESICGLGDVEVNPCSHSSPCPKLLNYAECFAIGFWGHSWRSMNLMRLPFIFYFSSIHTTLIYSPYISPYKFRHSIT